MVWPAWRLAAVPRDCGRSSGAHHRTRSEEAVAYAEQQLALVETTLWDTANSPCPCARWQDRAHVLRELRLVDREVPITDPDPLRSRKGRYRISDRYLAFHFRFLQPNLSLVHAGRGERVLSEFVRPQLDALFDDARVDFIVDASGRPTFLELNTLPGFTARSLARPTGRRPRSCGSPRRAA